MHDFAITPNWAIFLQNAISFNPLPFLFGQKGAAQCLASKPNGSPKFLLIPRDSGKFAGQPTKSINAPKGFVFNLTFSDSAGNDGVEVTSTTNSSWVVFDKTPPSDFNTGSAISTGGNQVSNVWKDRKSVV